MESSCLKSECDTSEVVHGGTLQSRLNTGRSRLFLMTYNFSTFRIRYYDYLSVCRAFSIDSAEERTSKKLLRSKIDTTTVDNSLVAVVHKQREVKPTPEREDDGHDDVSPPPPSNQNGIRSDRANPEAGNVGYQHVEQELVAPEHFRHMHFSSHEELTSAYRFTIFRY
jgi:hypothetical protein